MCGLNLEPDSRPGLSPVNPSSTPGALTSRGWPNKGPADVYPPPKQREQPHPGLAEGPKQPRKLSQKPPSPRKWLTRGLLRVQPQLRPHPLESHKSDPSWGLLRTQSSLSCTSGHCHLESSLIRGWLRIQSSQCCNRGHCHHKSSPIKWGLLRSCLGGSETT